MRRLGVAVRNTTLGDISGIIRVANQAFLEMARRTSRLGLSALRAWMQQPEYQFVAMDGEDVVGFLVGVVRKDEKEALIQMIGVHPDYQRMGIGSMLMPAFENAVRKEAKRVVTGTPYARRFYEKCGYKCFRVEHRFIKELARKPVAKDKVKFEAIDVEKLRTVISFLEEEAPSFLKAFFEAYESDPDKLLSAKIDGKHLGVIVAKTNEWTRELIEVTYIHGVDLNARHAILNSFEAKCSSRGVRWVGVSTDDQKLMDLLLKDGWVDAKLPMFWTRYWMEKDLTPCG